jgi:hypothetical protein
VWICGFECEAGDEESKTLDDCEHKCQKIKKAKGVIVQAEFHPDCIVTHLELLEYYCWGYDVSCDEEDIELWSQGDVDVCWDWCFNMESMGCLPSFTVDTDADGHYHNVEGIVYISCNISGETDEATVPISGDINITINDIDIQIPSQTITVDGTTEEGGAFKLEIEGDTENNTACTMEFSVDVETDTTLAFSGTTEAGGGGSTPLNIDVETTADLNWSGKTQPGGAYQMVDDGHTGDLHSAVNIQVCGQTDDGGGVDDTTGNNTACTVTSTGKLPGLSFGLLTIDDGIGVDKDVLDMTCDVNCSGTGCYCDCGCDLSGGHINITGDDILGLIDIEVNYLSNTVTVSGPLCDHTHSFTISDHVHDFDVSIPMPDHRHQLSYIHDIPNHTHDISMSDTVSLSFTISDTVTLLSHTHNFNVSDTVSLSFTVSDSIDLCSHTHPFSFTHEEPSHTHDFEFSFTISSVSDTISAEDISATISAEVGSHTHTFSAELSCSAQMTGTTNWDWHTREVGIPCQEVCVNSDAEFDLDIDAKFIPGYCTLRVAVLNKNFWEYYWYALCICTRALWHQGEMGPAEYDINTTPECNKECEAIDCGEPVYDCPEPTRNEYSLAEGEEVSWFKFAIDTTLLNMQTTCVERNPGECSVSASCSGDLSLPTLSECCEGCGDVGIELTDGDMVAGGRAWEGVGVGDMEPYCLDILSQQPAPAGSFLGEPLMRDFNAGLFDFIADDAADHLP